MTRKRGDGLRYCACGARKLPGSYRCASCYLRRWTEKEDTFLRDAVSEGWEYKKIGRLLARSGEACRNRASYLGLKQNREHTLTNRANGRARFYGNAKKVERRMKRMLKTFTPTERAIRAEELRQRNKAGITGMKGKHHTAEVRARISAAHKGRVMSTETRRKISEARKAYWAAKRDGGQSAYREAMLEDRRRLRAFGEWGEAHSHEVEMAWCGQCEKRVSVEQATLCGSPFCKAKALAA